MRYGKLLETSSYCLYSKFGLAYSMFTKDMVMQHNLVRAPLDNERRTQHNGAE